MTADQALFLLGDMLKTAALVSAPVLIVCLVIGLLVSVLQVVTQIQEMTLTFVPKLGAVVITLLLFGRWMLGQVVECTHRAGDGRGLTAPWSRRCRPRSGWVRWPPRAPARCWCCHRSRR
jgi:flagellar biosynthetic protein FliQ